MESERLLQLLAGKWLGEATEDELEELEQLLKLLPEEYEKEQLLDIYFQQRLAKKPASDKAKAAWQKHLEHMNAAFPDEFAAGSMPAETAFIGNSGHRTLSARKKWAVAASIGGIGLMFVIFSSKGKLKGKPEISAQASSGNAATAIRATIKKVLPDGTIVWLHGKSHIEYNEGFGETKRDITLTGEAFFDVAHNAAVPLTVHARTVNITVKGTAFNVKAYPEDSKVEASLIRGSIELAMKKTPGKKILLHPYEKITISIDEKTDRSSDKKRNRDKLYHIKELKAEPQSNLIPEISWMQNKLVFDSERFEEMVPRMEKWYDVTITTGDAELKDQRFSAVFEKETIGEALTALQFTYKFHFEIKDKQVIISKNKSM